MTGEPAQPDSRASAAAVGVAGPRGTWRNAALFPQHYVWYVFLSALDVMFTSMILHADGSELNSIADWVIRNYNLQGMVAYKFVLVAFVVIICEVVGRVTPETGRKLARWAVMLNAFPVIVGGIHLMRFSMILRAG